MPRAFRGRFEARDERLQFADSERHSKKDDVRVAPALCYGRETPSSEGQTPYAKSGGCGRIGGVVIGGDYQGLGIVRSLGRRNIPVCVIDDEISIARFSKYTTYAVSVRSLREERTAIDALLEASRRLDLRGWVIYPTRDETVAALAQYRSELVSDFRVPTPGWETIQWVWDKRNTYRLAQELDIPTPRTWYANDEKDLQLIDAAPPFAIKPAIKEHFIYATKAKAWRANNQAELHDLYCKASVHVGTGEAMIQEFIPGDGRNQFAYCAFYKEGQPVGSMVVRRTRQHPVEFGRASTYVETVDLPILEKYSECFLRAINYYGLVELEYILDPRDGQYKLLDVNGRTWGYHTLGMGAGVDFPSLLFGDQVGEPMQPCRGQPGVKWIRLLTDLPTGFVEIAGGRQNLGSYLNSLKQINVESVFSRDDPLPGLVELALVPYLSVKRGF